MALSSDLDHAEILRRGPKAWNAWREQNPNIVPELAGIALKLSERQMGPANGGPINLKAARLQDAFLRFATLSAGNLAAADLSGADLVHARFDDANLSAANLSNAKLDHADFARANLRNVDLSGASLSHAKNLTQAQLEDSKGSDSTILPAGLQGFVSWSARGQSKTNVSRKIRELEAEAPETEDRREVGSFKRPVWMAGVVLIGGALLIAGLVWRNMNDARPIADAQTEPKPPVVEQKFQPSAPQAVVEKTLDSERPPPAEAAIPPIPSNVSSVDAAESKPEQNPVRAPDDGVLAPQATSTAPQASEAAAPVPAEPSIVAVPDLPAETLLVTDSVKSPGVTARHGTVPDAAPDSTAIAAPATGSGHGATSEPPAEAAIADVAPPVVTDIPAEPLEPSSPATASLGDAVTPSAIAPAVPPSDVTGSLPDSEVKGAGTDSPHEAAPVPMPVRKPMTETSVANSEAEIPPKPEKDAVAHPERSRLAKGPNVPRSRSRVCVPILGQHFEGQCL